jgi:DNA polymerase III epsilon subunit-like protein
MLVLVFDTETTGLPKSKIVSSNTLNYWPHIVQFSYVVYDTNTHKIIKMKDWIVKLAENITIPEETTKIHGITNEMSKNKGVDISTVFEEFFDDFYKCAEIVAHNLNFDFNMVNVEMYRMIENKNTGKKSETELKEDLNYFNNCKKFYCTMQETIEFCNIELVNKGGKKYLKFPRLSELYKKLFDETPNNLHNSLNDTVICLRCFMKWKYDVDIAKGDNEIRSFIEKNLHV